MTVIMRPHGYSNTLKPGHLDDVKAYMMEHGAPTIRVVAIADMYQAIEGCHRLTAASELMADDSFEFDVTPELDILDCDELVNWDSIDFSEHDFNNPETMTWGDLACVLYEKNVYFRTPALEF